MKRISLAGLATLFLLSASSVIAQNPKPAEPAGNAQSAPKPAEDNPFAPQAAQPLPPGMTGPSVTDPRYKLKAGVYDAGETSSGLRHLTLVKKPNAFQLGTDDANSPKVQNMLGQLGIPNNGKMPDSTKMVLAQLAFANSDLAFQGNHLFQGNFYGVNIFDISNPAKAKVVTTLVCPGGQGDVSVYGHLLFMSVEMPNGRLDCGTQGFPAEPPAPAAEDGTPARRRPPAPQKDRFRGVRIFDISDIANPKQVAAVQTCRGSHTHTLVVDPNDKNNVYIYVSGTSFVRQSEELEGCSGEEPDKDPNTSLFRIDVIQVPLAAPQEAKIVSSPRVFMDARTGALNGLSNGGSHDKNAQKPADTNQCHDITAYSAIGLAAGACSGNGLILDIKDPAHPKRVDAVNDPNYAYWHSASFSNDGTKVVFTDEWGGGLGARCRPTDPMVWGADAIFKLQDDKLSFVSYYKLPAAQGDTENCVAHNGSLIPVPGRDIEVQAWYQGGVSVMDFTDPSHPYEIAYYDRGPISPTSLVLGGDWSAYWYNGYIYGSEIARGLDVFELTPSKYLTKNEIAAAKSVRVSELNVQNQQKIEWPNKTAVAKAYLDQLARSQALSSARISELRNVIAKIEKSNGSDRDSAKLKEMTSWLEETANSAKNSSDAARLRGLSAILNHPASDRAAD